MHRRRGLRRRYLAEIKKIHRYLKQTLEFTLNFQVDLKPYQSALLSFSVLYEGYLQEINQSDYACNHPSQIQL